jgi:hypothetical protein
MEIPSVPEDSLKSRIMTFNQVGEKVEVKCRLVDLNTPEYDKEFEDAPLFRKNAEVKARQATTREEIETALDATRSVAEPGDWIVTNPGGEVYTVKKKTFENAYRQKEGEEGTFATLGVPVKAVQVNADIAFMAPWGSEQGVRSGGYVVERQDNGERYGIEKAAFEATYVAIEEKK